MAIRADVYDQARSRAAAARAGLDAFFGPCDAVLVPAAPGEAPVGLGNTGNPIFNRMWTLLGVPCAALPAGFAGNAQPNAILLLGRIPRAPGLTACWAFSPPTPRLSALNSPPPPSL